MEKIELNLELLKELLVEYEMLRETFVSEKDRQIFAMGTSVDYFRGSRPNKYRMELSLNYNNGNGYKFEKHISSMITTMDYAEASLTELRQECEKVGSTVGAFGSGAFSNKKFMYDDSVKKEIVSYSNKIYNESRLLYKTLMDINNEIAPIVEVDFSSQIQSGRRQMDQIRDFSNVLSNLGKMIMELIEKIIAQLSRNSETESDTDTQENNGEDNSEDVGNDVVGMEDWIPEIMRLDGDTPEEQYLAKRLSRLRIPWTQEKVNELWNACIEIEKTYGIQIDPRFLLTIIIQEGTGSFNTSSTNLAADGQNGVETNFSIDLIKANNLIFGKILGYAYYGEEFRKIAENNADKLNSSTGDMFDYINWNTPIVDVKNEKVRQGVYAGHSAWGVGVESIYEKITGNGMGEEYSQYIANIDPEIINGIVNDIGVELPDYNFEVVQNGQNSKGDFDSTWTIIGVK